MKKLLSIVSTIFLTATLALADGTVQNAGYQGSFKAGEVVDFKFASYTQSTGAPAALAGTPVVSLYRDGVDVETTTGVTLTASFDSVTGLNDVSIDTTAFTTGNYTAVITTGTVGTTVVGYTVGSFSVDIPRQSNLSAVNGGSTGATAGKLELAQLKVASTTNYETAVEVRGGPFGGDGVNIRGGAADDGDDDAGGTAIQLSGGFGGALQPSGYGLNIAHGSDGGGGSRDSVRIAGPVILAPTGTNETALALTPSGTGKAINALGQVYVAPTNTNDDAVKLVPDGTGVGIAGFTTDPAIAITVTPKKNTAITAFPFVMYNSSGTPTPSLTVTCTVSLDGGAFGACANAVSGIGSGAYKINLATTDTNGDTVILKFTATGARPTIIPIVMEP
jgi:hypothetical protein